MANAQIIASLQQVELFRGLRPEQMAAIARHAEKLKLGAGDTITTAGQPGDGAYLVVSGTAEALQGAGAGAPLVRQPIAFGTMIGELAMLIEHVYDTTTFASDRVHCLKLTRAAMHEQMRADPTLADLISVRIRERLLRLSDGLLRFEPEPASHRGGPVDAGAPLAFTPPAAMRFRPVRAAGMR